MAGRDGCGKQDGCECKCTDADVEVNATCETGCSDVNADLDAGVKMDAAAEANFDTIGI